VIELPFNARITLFAARVSPGGSAQSIAGTSRKIASRQKPQIPTFILIVYYIERFQKYNYNETMKKIVPGILPALVLALCILSGFFSCSRTEPRILYGFIELVYYQGNERPAERYSFFILSEDDDGIENLLELYLYHDREGLRWLVSAEDWIQHEADGKAWIGSRHIAMPYDASLPRGQYRAVLVNKGGERTERRFTFDGPEVSPYPFPIFTINEGTYRINSRYPVNHLVCYDQQGNAVRTIKVAELQGSIRSLNLPENAFSAALWAEDPEYRISAFTEVSGIR
jgi:hypothetical protein